MFLVRYGQFLATLCATACQYTATIGSSHSLTETVLVVTATVVGLKCSFHIDYCLIIDVHIWIRGAKLSLFFHLHKY